MKKTTKTTKTKNTMQGMSERDQKYYRSLGYTYSKKYKSWMNTSGKPYGSFR